MHTHVRGHGRGAAEVAASCKTPRPDVRGLTLAVHAAHALLWAAGTHASAFKSHADLLFWTSHTARGAPRRACSATVLATGHTRG